MAGVQVWSLSADERREFGTGRVWCWKVEDMLCCYCCKGPEDHWSLWGISSPFAETLLTLPFSLSRSLIDLEL